MPRYHRSIAALLSALICASFCVCCNSSSTETASTTPTATPPPPLPDVSPMINRLVTQDGSKDSTTEMRMTSIDETGKRDQLVFKLQRKYLGDRISTFMTVLSPPEETDKAFLAIEHPDKATEAFSYLAGLKKLAELRSDRQLSFNGARTTVQELIGLELSKYTQNGVERVTLENEPLIKVELKEKPDRHLAYPRIIAFFREKDQTPFRFELYDSRNELQKRVNIDEIKQIQNHQTITRVSVDDIQQKLKLKLDTLKFEYDRGLPDRLFTEENLKSFISGASRKLDENR